MSRRSVQVVAALPVMLALACSSPQGTGSGSITQAYAPLVRESPLGVPDTCIYIEDTPNGADVTFTTTPSYVSALRSRVREQAAMHGPGAHKGRGHSGVHGTAPGHGLRLWDMPIGAVDEVEIDRGARLEVVASDPSKVAELRAHLRERAARLRASDCP